MSKPVTIELYYPIDVNGSELKEFTLRKPNLMALRDVPINLLQLGQGVTLDTLLPRITEPQLTSTSLNRLDPCDLGQISLTLASFFTPPTKVNEETQN